MELLTPEIIYGFAASLLHHRFDKPKPTPDFHMELWDLCCSDNDLVAIAAPRGHAKSTAITHTFVLACALFKEKDYILIVSDTEGQAVEFLGDIKRELQENEELMSVFGVKRFIKDTEKDIIVETNDGAQFRILARGSEQKVRGRKWRNKRPNLIIGDDLENDEIVMNDDRRAKFQNWFDQALCEAGSGDCLIRIVGTVLHMDSLLENLMPEWGAKTTHTDGLRHWTTEKDPIWHSVRYQAHNDDFSKILWEEQFSQRRLERKRRSYVERGNPAGYAQEYLNYPIDEATSFYRKEDFKPIKDHEEFMEYYIGGDLAISEKDSRAYTVFVVAGLTTKNILKIVDVVRFRGDSLEIIDTLFDLHQIYNPEAFFIEKENIARSIGPFLIQEQNTRGIYLNVGEDTMIVPTQDKVKRAQSMRARARAGGVQVDEDAPWYNSFITECVQFPRGVYKDQVDALSMIGLGLAKMTAVPTNEELLEEDWENEFGEFDVDQGRDLNTGY